MHRAACDWAECVCFNLSFVWAIPAVKLIYYDVPRAGSSSIKLSIRTKFPTIDPDDTMLDEYKSFSVVRNPWDRTLSAWLLFTTYNQGARGSQRKMQCKELFGHLPPFEEFVDRMMDEGCRNHHWAPIVDFFPANGRVDYLLDLSTMKKSWSTLQVDYPDLPSLMHWRVGKSRDKHYSFYYTDKMRDLVEKYFQEDIERFGSTFEDQR